MRIIITGSIGFIGSHLVRELSSHTLMLADKKLGIDITDDFYETHKRFRPDLIYHLAAQTSVQDSDYVRMLQDNILGTQEIAKFRCPIVFTSSGGVYGGASLPSKENDTLMPENVYSATKVIGERILQGKTILRLSNVYGEGGHGVYEKLKSGHRINGDGEATRDFIHVSDVIRALIMAQSWTGVFNIGTGIETSVNQLADILGVEKVYAPAVTEQRRSCLDISKATQMGWKPFRNL